jgi:hypothetical protein
MRKQQLTGFRIEEKTLRCYPQFERKHRRVDLGVWDRTVWNLLIGFLERFEQGVEVLDTNCMAGRRLVGLAALCFATHPWLLSGVVGDVEDVLVTVTPKLKTFVR